MYITLICSVDLQSVPSLTVYTILYDEDIFFIKFPAFYFV
jgi:hypothetical protein